MTAKNHWDEMYRRPLQDIPWEIEEPPKELRELVERKRLAPCRALDMGCGSGSYSVYLAKKGFDVTGIDIAPAALEIARQRADEAGVNVTFVEGDLKDAYELVEGPFGFILDYSIFHHIPHERTQEYADELASLLAPDGLLLLVCYTDDHELAQGNSTATGTAGNTMYFRTATEIAAAFTSLTLVSHKPGRLGKGGKHPAHVFLYRRKEVE